MRRFLIAVIVFAGLLSAGAGVLNTEPKVQTPKKGGMGDPVFVCPPFC